MNRINAICLALLVMLSAVTAGCSPIPGEQPTRAGLAASRSAQLTPYHSPTATLTPAPDRPTQTGTPVPSATPTPRIHEVQKGEDLFGIALQYGLSLSAIKTANPAVNPQFLSIGTNLTIPHAGGPSPTPAPQDAAAVTPTAVPVETASLNCLQSAEGGAWCFFLVRNPHSFPLESLSAAIRLADSDTQAILEQAAFMPLDLLPAGARLPLVAYFPPPVPAPLRASGELITSLPHALEDGRYLPVQVEDLQVEIEASGYSAAVSFTGRTAEGARLVRVAAVAYDSDGQVIGVRRWEYENASPLEGGEALPVAMRVYSVSGIIERVEVYAEARP